MTDEKAIEIKSGLKFNNWLTAATAAMAIATGVAPMAAPPLTCCEGDHYEAACFGCGRVFMVWGCHAPGRRALGRD